MEKSRAARISILMTTATLIAMGVVMIYSASSVYAYDKFGDNFFFLKRHLVSLAIGLFFALVFMSLDMAALRAHSKKFVIASILLLIFVLVPGLGAAAGGARRWLRAGGMQFQPVEFVKPFFLLYLADFLDRKSLKKNQLFIVYIPLLIIVCLICGLVLLQPDLGSSVELVVIGLTLLFVHGARIKHLFFTIIAAVPALALMILRSPYRLSRMLAFIDPWKDPRGTGFQIIQSFIALGSGGFFGVGLGNSKQKLFYLPESHTDFIFSIVGEELGFLGAGLVVILFAVFVWKGMEIALKKGSEFSRLLAFGISFMIGLEAVINIGVATGVLPTKGLPLPFLSYGGSSLVSHMILVAMLMNLGRENVR